jgi:hypothetical protein
MDDLSERDPEVPYLKAEHIFRDLVCSLIERQDRVNEQLFNHINDVQYRMDDIEEKFREKFPEDYSEEAEAVP